MTAPAGAGIDPRIRERRIAVRREEGRRRLRAVVAALAVVIAVVLVLGVTRSPLLDVDAVEVRGADRTPEQRLAAATGLRHRPPMVEVDTGRVARRVERLPWVLEARVQRVWPGTVRVSVVERTPVAVVPAEGGRWALVDDSGRVLEVVPDKPPGFPAVGDLPPPGAPGTLVSAEARVPLQVAAALPEALRARIADLAVVAGGDVEMQLTPPGGVVRLGPPDDLHRKLAALAALFSEVDLARVAVIDVRAPSAPALTRR